MSSMFESVINLISESIQDAKVEVTDLTGTKDHLGILVISDEFKELALLDQHQKIMDILKPRLASDIHAVKIKTMTWEKAKKKGLA